MNYTAAADVSERITAVLAALFVICHFAVEGRLAGFSALPDLVQYYVHLILISLVRTQDLRRQLNEALVVDAELVAL
jgi:hypothetical protein